MSDLFITLHWSLKNGTLTHGQYDATHDVTYSGGFSQKMAPAPDYGGDPQYANPEEALAAALSSCYMMTFLALAAKTKWQVQAYQDRAVATLGKDQTGKTKVTSITLNPSVKFASGADVTLDKLQEMHERAHKYCFVANSLDLTVDIIPNQENNS